jgi:hypothetical protein
MIRVDQRPCKPVCHKKNSYGNAKIPKGIIKFAWIQTVSHLSWMKTGLYSPSAIWASRRGVDLDNRRHFAKAPELSGRSLINGIVSASG